MSRLEKIARRRSLLLGFVLVLLVLGGYSGRSAMAQLSNPLAGQSEATTGTADSGQDNTQQANSPESGQEDKEEGVSDRLADALEELSEEHPVLGAIAKVLLFRIVTVQGREVTVLNILIALIVLYIGWRLSSRVAKTAHKRVVDRVHIDRSYATFLENLIRYLLVLIVAIFAMQVAGIPVGVFAFLGGAVAIAVGFGAQEVLANFIGGLILMFEKPIRQGDLIEFEGQRAKVVDVGARFTRLRVPGNVDLIVPNRKLLENPFINWTLTDDQVRTDIVVGIAYGSPTREADKLIRKAVEEHPKVDTSPEPIILFEEFGDNSLQFRVFFWVRVMQFLDQQRIESDIRYKIDDYFREAGITIAFPQRDVHLDTLSPLHVRLLEKHEEDAEK